MFIVFFVVFVFPDSSGVQAEAVVVAIAQGRDVGLTLFFFFFFFFAALLLPFPPLLPPSLGSRNHHLALLLLLLPPRVSLAAPAAPPQKQPLRLGQRALLGLAAKAELLRQPALQGRLGLRRRGAGPGEEPLSGSAASAARGV